MIQQSTNTILMVRPAAFGYNNVTAKDNVFQEHVERLNDEQVHEKALVEFDGFVEKLKAEGINVIVIKDTPEPKKPDAIFPNNWFTTHPNGFFILYPTFAQNRRWERRRGIIDLIGFEYEVDEKLDLTYFEEDGKFLEGTGSMIFDRANHYCYAALSNRTHEEVLQQFTDRIGYKEIAFRSLDEDDFPIYHTNVMMSVASDFVIVCLESIKDDTEREQLENMIHHSEKVLIPISFEQVTHFCGNVIELLNDQGEKVLVMSDQAYKAFTPKQLEQIQRYNKILHAPLYTIETVGGGGARCMIAEIFLPKKNDLRPSL